MSSHSNPVRANRGQHGLLTRMFLRDCAFLMSLYRRSDDRWVWTYSTLSLSVTLSSCAFFALTTLALRFHAQIPANINPLTADSSVRLAEFIGLPVLIGAWVDFHFRRFRDDVGAAKYYSSAQDVAKWWLVTILTVGFTIGIGVLLVLFGAAR